MNVNAYLLVQVVIDEVRRKPALLDLPLSGVLDAIYRACPPGVHLEGGPLAFCLRQEFGTLLRKYRALEEVETDDDEAICHCGHAKAWHMAERCLVNASDMSQPRCGCEGFTRDEEATR